MEDFNGGNPVYHHGNHEETAKELRVICYKKLEVAG